MTFDKGEYEREQHALIKTRTRAVRAMPSFRLDENGRGPVVLLTCPRGHKLLPVAIEETMNGLLLVALPDQQDGASPVAVPDEPWRRGPSVCGRPGCPETVESGVGYCGAHGGSMRTLGDVRTRFMCRASKHGWQRPVTTARLLERYALAVHTGQDRVPIQDT